MVGPTGIMKLKLILILLFLVVMCFYWQLGTLATTSQ